MHRDCVAVHPPTIFFPCGTNLSEPVCGLRSVSQSKRPKRVKAIYNCVADNPDELTFSEGEVIVVDGEEDQEWWVSICQAANSLFYGRLHYVLRFPTNVPLLISWMSADAVTMAAEAKSHDLTPADIPPPPLFPPAAASSVEPLVWTVNQLQLVFLWATSVEMTVFSHSLPLCLCMDPKRLLRSPSCFPCVPRSAALLLSARSKCPNESTVMRQRKEGRANADSGFIFRKWKLVMRQVK